jgi:hypothetical protein
MTCLILLAVMMADPCVSGVPVGKRPGPYSFLVATGPERGKQTCFICEQAEKPAVVVFTRLLSDPVGRLMATLDAEVPPREKQGFKVWMTQLTDKADLDALAKWSQKQALKNVPVGAFEDSDGPPAYKLAAEAEVTVLVFVKEKVVVNRAYRAGELNEVAIKDIKLSLQRLNP